VGAAHFLDETEGAAVVDVRDGIVIRYHSGAELQLGVVLFLASARYQKDVDATAVLWAPLHFVCFVVLCTADFATMA
jgi:energy-converting hydrogenase Eha subunit C